MTRKSPSRYLTSASPGIGAARSVRLSKTTSDCSELLLDIYGPKRSKLSIGERKHSRSLAATEDVTLVGQNESAAPMTTARRKSR
jgi:hypothetical protein